MKDSRRPPDRERLLIKHATILTGKAQGAVVVGDVLIEGHRIAAIGPDLPDTGGKILDARGKLLLPGFIQSHVHLCQTSFRGLAEDRELLPWLEESVYPAEAALTPETIYDAAVLGIKEMLSTGVTTVCTMESVHHTDAVFQACREMGIRAVVGKALMDQGEAVPPGLLQDADTALIELEELYARFHGAQAGRLRCAVAPRFGLACSPELLRDAADFARQKSIFLHTHAAENPREVEAVRRLTGFGNIEYLHRLGVLGERTLIAHVVHPDEGELDLIQASGAAVAHCPTANLKLGSGIAPVAQMLRMGILVGLGSDGAACNNALDIWQEMKLAALLQSVKERPGALTAAQALHLATLGGAQAIGWDDQIGSVEVGKKADLILVNPDQPHWQGQGDWPSRLVYSGRAADVEWAMVDGRIVWPAAG
jgi:cytosine/adenosine deaminase-related metal-dependent hydrolase